MIIDLTRLINNIDKEIVINEIYSFGDEYIDRRDVLELNDVKIDGKITKNNLGNLILDITLSGVMVLPCAITLKPVNHNFNIEINGNLEEMFKEINEFDKKIENSIDILPIIWENILMEIPIKVVSDDAEDIELHGDGWRLITNQKKEDINPEFQKLNQLFEEK